MTIRDIAIAFGYEVDEKSEKKVNESIDKLKSVATKALGAIGIGFSLVNAKQIIEEFGKINAQIKNATKELGNQEAAQREIVDAANAARTSYADIAKLTTKLVQENNELFDVSSAAKYAELTTKLFKSENKEQGEILGLQEAINKSFAKGAVDSETISQILEQSPAGANMLAKHVGVARSELEQMASDGKISLEQLRDAFFDNADEIEAAFANVDLTISDALLNIRNQWGLWLTQMDKTLGVTKTIAKVMTRTFTQFMNVLRKAQTYTERFVKKVGGAENALKLLAMAAGAIFIALNAGKILDFLTLAKKAITGINLKTVALVAAIMLIALAVDDFINFMKGNDSVIGVIFEKWGVDADAVRKKIIGVWDKLKSVLLEKWEALKKAFSGLGQFIKGVISGDWKTAFDGLKTLVGSTLDFLAAGFGKFAPVVKAVGIAFATWKIGSATKELVKGTANVAKDTVKLVGNTAARVANTVATKAGAAAQKAWNVAAKAGSAVTKGLGSAFKFLASPAGLAVIAIAALIGIIAMLIKNGGDVDALVQQFSDGLTKFTGIVDKVVAGISEKLPQIIDTVVGVVTKVLNSIVEKLPLFIDMGIKLITSLLDGIMRMLPKIIDAAIKLILAIVQAIIQLLPKLLDAGIKLIMSLLKGIVSMLPQIIDAIINLIMSLINAIVGMLPQIIDAGVKLIVSLIEGIVSMLPQIIEAIIQLVTSLITAIVDMLPQLIDAGIQLIMSLLDGIISALPDIIKAVVGLIPKLITAIVSNLPKIIKAGIQIIISLITGIVKAIPQIIKAIIELIPVIVKALIDALPQLIQAGIEIIIALATGLVQAIPELVKAIPQIIGAIIEGFGAIFSGMGDIIGGFVDMFKSAFKGIADFFKNIWNGIVDFFKGIWEGVKNFFKGIWDGIVQTVQKNIETCKAVFKAVGDFFKNIWNAIVSFFKGIWDKIVDVVNGAIETVKGIFTAVGDFFKGIWNGIADFFKGLWDGLLNVVNGFVDMFKSAFTAVSDFFKNIWSGISDFFSGIWDGIKNIFSGVGDFFSNIFKGAVDGIKNVFSGVKDFFSNIFESIVNVVKAPINWIIGGINGFIDGINSIKIPDWVPGIGGAGFNIPHIPELAKGGVLKKGQTGYLEGDGAEAVVPLEKNTEWIKKVAALFKKDIDGGDSNSGAGGLIEAVKNIGGVVGNAVKTVAEKVTSKDTESGSSLLDTVKSIGGAVGNVIKTVAGKITDKDKQDKDDPDKNKPNGDLGGALKSFVSSVSALAKNATASPGTAQTMVTSTTNRSITQNNYFESTFNGDRAGQQRSSEAMSKSADDATGQLARALAFSR